MPISPPFFYFSFLIILLHSLSKFYPFVVLVHQMRQVVMDVFVIISLFDDVLF